MRKSPVVILVALIVAASSCTSSASKSRSSSGPQKHVTIEFWTGASGPGFTAVRKLLDTFESTHPGITVHAVPDQGDPTKTTLAIASGTGPDLTAAFSNESVAKACASGALVDLGTYEDTDHVTPDLFPAWERTFMQTAGKRCAIPYVADDAGLYYNQALLAKAGFTSPPRTIDELANIAVKTTQYNSDGSIKVAGFVPLMGFAWSYPDIYAGWFGVHWIDATGKAQLASDPHAAAMFQFEKKIVDAIGYDKLKTFVAKAGADESGADEFNNGKVAMLVDGEWRNAFIHDDFPKFKYATVPLPSTTSNPADAGPTFIASGTLAIPRNSKHPAEAWELARFLGVDTDNVVQYIGTLHNIPTTLAALKSPKLNLGYGFTPFLDSAANPNTLTTPTWPSGPVWKDPIGTFTDDWEAGKISDLQAGLVKLDDTIDKLISQS